jgi:hypothetical protein
MISKLLCNEYNKKIGTYFLKLISDGKEIYISFLFWCFLFYYLNEEQKYSNIFYKIKLKFVI